MDLDLGLGLQGPQFLEVPMVEEEEEIFEEIMEDGGGELAEAFMANVIIQAPGVGDGNPQLHDVVFEEQLVGEDLFDLF